MMNDTDTEILLYGRDGVYTAMVRQLGRLPPRLRKLVNKKLIELHVEMELERGKTETKEQN